MKSRGANLEKHYAQAFEYWTHIVPRRPPFVIHCNFDGFWISKIRVARPANARWIEGES